MTSPGPESPTPSPGRPWASSLAALGLVLAALTLAWFRVVVPAEAARRRAAALVSALDALRDGTPPEFALPRLEAALELLEAPGPSQVVGASGPGDEPGAPGDEATAAIGLTIALLRDDPQEAERRLAALAALDTPFGRAVARFRATPDRTPPDPVGESEVAALVLDGWRLAFLGDDTGVDALLARVPAIHRQDFHFAAMEAVSAARREARQPRKLVSRIEDLLARIPARSDLPGYGLGPDAFAFRLEPDPDGTGVSLVTSAWNGQLVRVKESRTRRRLDLLLSLSSVLQAADEPNRSLFHAQVADGSSRPEVDRMGAGDLLDRLLYPRPHLAAFEAAARSYDLDVHLLLALAREESHFKPDAISSAGARGLLQLMPETAQWIETTRQRPVPGLLDLLDPTRNLELGAWYLAYLGSKFGHAATRWKWAMAAYNAGLKPTTRWLNDWKARRRKAAPPKPKPGETPPEPEPEPDPEDVIDYPETRAYVAKVTRSWDAYRRVWGKAGTPPRKP